tara:strand:- start:8004 stop:8243 length:240 start_codon:yes stop_codon:yes gene_type:complete
MIKKVPKPKVYHELKSFYATAGEDSRVAKLTEENVRYIRANYYRESYAKSNTRELADKFNVTTSTILQIVKYRTWQNVK